MEKYLDNIYHKMENKYPNQTEYLNSLKPMLESFDELVKDNPKISELNIIERLITPDRVISFKVPWVNDQGEVLVNTGYRVQFNNLLGPYKGGLRFHPSVNESVLKFLALEQTLKNSLTGLPLGGAKGGADLDPKGMSDFEMMRFTNSYMTELSKYLGPDIDVPAGDIGVSKREIGYLFGTYKRMTNRHNGTLTGKDISYGGSLLRPEATGYGLCYITNAALKRYHNTDFKDKLVLISGTGKVALNAAFKARELGGIVVAMSATTGVINDNNGLDLELIRNIKDNRKSIKEYLKTYPKALYKKDPKSIWDIKCDIALPSATQDEADLKDIEKLIKNGVLIVAEGANKPLTNDASTLLKESNILFIPSKAANAGGVSVSSFEMAQNSTHSSWSALEVDTKLKETMINIFENIYKTAKDLGNIYDLEKAANLFAFNKLYEAMLHQGI